MKIGKANYSGGSNFKRNIAKLKDGDNVYRILPPLGSMADSGKFSRYLRVEWGYKDTTGANRPFQDVRVVNRKTKMVEVESFAHLNREKIKAELEALVALYRQGKASDSEVKAKKDEVLRYNLDNKHFLNAINTKGEIVLLKLGHRAKLALDAAIKALEAQGIDPLSVDNGRFFNIRRSGNALDTAFNIEVAKENVKVEGMGILQRDIVHVLDDSILNRLATEATDLGTLDKMYPIITAQQVEQIVTGGPEVVDAVLGKRQNNDDSMADEGADEESAPAAAYSTPAATIESTTAPVAAAPVMAAPAPAKVATPEPASKEDFLKTLGL